MRRMLLISLATLLAPLASASGQTVDLEHGQIIRVTAHPYDLRRTPVTLVELGPDSLRVQYLRSRLDHSRVITDSLDLAVPLTAVTKIEVPNGRRSNWDRGARTGAIAGGAVGLLLGGVYAACNDSMVCPETGAQKAGAIVASTVMVGLAGGVVGAIIGAMSSREAWKEVPTGRPRISVIPQRNGMTVTLSMRF